MPAGPDVASLDGIVSSCTRVLFDYASHLDFDEGKGAAECFAADAVWRAPEGEFRGRDEIRTFFDRRPVSIRTRHLWTNLLFDLTNPTRPTCTGYVQMARMDVDRPHHEVETMFIDVRDTFVNEGGRWVVLLHDCTPAFPAPGR